MSENLRHIPAKVAFSSASVYPTGVREVLSTKRTTEALGDNIVKAHRSLGTIFGPENVSVSVLMGRNVDETRLEPTLKGEGVSVHSIDIPAKKSLTVAIPQAAGNAFILRIEDAQGHIGWAYLNAGSERQQRKRTAQGLEIAGEGDVRRVVKANAGFFHGRSEKLLIKQLKEANGEIILAVEIDAVGGQSVEDYEKLMRRLQREYNEEGNLEVRLDVDTGALALALENHREPGRTPKPVTKVVEELFEDPLGEATELISVNQYVSGPTYHASMDANGGVVDIPKVARLVGQGMRAGVLHEGVAMLVEPDPRDQKNIFHGERGRVLFEGMNTAFNEGAENVQEPVLRVAS